jgi:hypothetical protein
LLAFWEWTGFVDSHSVPFPGEPDRRCDTVFEFKRRDGSAPATAMVVEVSSTPQSDIMERLGEYGFTFRRTVLYQLRKPPVKYVVVTRLLNLTGDEQSGTFEMTMKDLPDCGMGVWTKPVTFSRLDATATLAGISSGDIAKCILVWIPLMFKGDLPEVVSEWKRLVNSESDEKMRGAYVILAKTFAAFVDRPIWQQELEGFNVITSPIFDEIRNEARKEGHKEGLKEGRTETQREVATAFRPELLEFLTSKFGSGVSSGITARINAELDFEVLNRWFRAARISNTVEEFLKQMELKK